jgi:hypothetical protein
MFSAGVGLPVRQAPCSPRKSSGSIGLNEFLGGNEPIVVFRTYRVLTIFNKTKGLRFLGAQLVTFVALRSLAVVVTLAFLACLFTDKISAASPSACPVVSVELPTATEARSTNVQPEIHVVTADGSSVHKVFLPAGTPPTLAITSGTAETRPTNACFVGGETASGGSQQAIAPAMKALLAAIPVRHAKADYDGDGLTDIAIFQPSIATWFVWLSKSQSLMAL